MEKKISVHIALFLMLLIAVLLTVIPILGISPLTPGEQELLSMANTIQNATLNDIYSGTELYNRITVVYAYAASLLISPDTESSTAVFLLRLPSAIIMIILILSLFRFDGMVEQLNKSFFASMLFLSCGFIGMITFHASPITIPTIFLILSLICLYHWIRRRTKKYILLMVLTTAVATISLGAVAPIVVFIMAVAFLATTRLGNVKNWAIIIISMLLSCAITYLAVLLISGNRDLAKSIFSIISTISYIAEGDMNIAKTFVNYIIFAVFPWSIPLIISSFLVVTRPKWIVEKFKSLKLLQRFAITLFIISIPTLFVFTNISIILIVASIFFNMPLIANFMLSKTQHYSIMWRITGLIAGSVIGFGITLYILLNNGIELDIFGLKISLIKQIWNGWNISVIIAIYISLYTLWKGQNSIQRNNRYRYSLIVLYLLAQTFYIGFINHNIVIS